jgi:hypothetical protein
MLLLAGSIMVTMLSYLLGLPFFFLFLFIPVISLWRRGQKMKHCPVCGYEASGEIRFCPYDGTELEKP